MRTGTSNRPRNIMRIRNLTRTGIILALGTERLYLEPTRRSPAIVRWSQNQIGITCSHFEFGASHQCLQVPILEDIAHVEGIPDPDPFTLFLVDQHVFSNCDRQRRFHFQRRERGRQRERDYWVFGGKMNGFAAKRTGIRSRPTPLPNNLHLRFVAHKHHFLLAKSSVDGHIERKAVNNSV